MKPKLWPLVLLCGIVYGWQNYTQASSLRLREKHHHRRSSKPCERSFEIPKILHYIFLDGEAVYWRNATLGDDFVPNYYPRTKEKGERNATFRHEWKTGCERFMPEWMVHQHPQSRVASGPPSCFL